MSHPHLHDSSVASPFSNDTDTGDFSSVSLSSKLTALLASNEPPTENQAVLLQKLYVEKRTQLASSGPAAAFLPGRLEENLRTVLHPLRRLPLELLNEIFTLVVGKWDVGPGAQSIGFVSELAMMMAPWKLALVSRRWRSVALSSPRLWSTIVVNWFVDNVTIAAEYFRIHLERSGSSPLNVCLVISRLEVEDVVWQSLVKTCEQWRKLGLDLGLADEVSGLGLAGMKSRLVSLESVYVNAPLSGPENIAPTDVFESAPKLRFVAGSGDALNYYRFPWAQIEGYHEAREAEDDWNPDFEFLRQMVSIQALKISLFPGEGHPTTPVQWQHLSQLCLRFKTFWGQLGGSLNDFISQLSLPQLTHLILCSDSQSLPLFSCFPTVQHLCICNYFSGWSVTLTEDLVISCTAPMHNLKSLYTQNIQVGADGALLQAVSSADWPPFLEALYIQFDDKPDQILKARPSLSIHFDIPISTYLDRYGFVFNAEFPEADPLGDAFEEDLEY